MIFRSKNHMIRLFHTKCVYVLVCKKIRDVSCACGSMAFLLFAIASASALVSAFPAFNTCVRAHFWIFIHLYFNIHVYEYTLNLCK